MDLRNMVSPPCHPEKRGLWLIFKFQRTDFPNTGNISPQSHKTCTVQRPWYVENQRWSLASACPSSWQVMQNNSMNAQMGLILGHCVHRRSMASATRVAGHSSVPIIMGGGRQLCEIESSLFFVHVWYITIKHGKTQTHKCTLGRVPWAREGLTGPWGWPRQEPYQGSAG